MGFGLAPVFSVPPVDIQQLKHLKLATNQVSRLQFPKSYVGKWKNRTQYTFAKCSRGNNFRVYCSQVQMEENISDETCELVNGTEITIGDEEDGIRAYLCTAVKNNNATGILLLSDIFGFEDSSTRDFAYRVACNGYNVLVPDLFNGDPWTKDRPKALFEQWIANHNSERITKDVFTSAKWMITEFVAVGLSNKLGIVGFCFGGGRVINILTEDEEGCFGSGVSFYGTRIDSSGVKNVKVPLLLVTGNNDALCPVSVVEEIEKENKELIKMEVFEGRGHGFAHRPQTPEEDEDAEAAFILMRNWLHSVLLVKQADNVS